MNRAKGFEVLERKRNMNFVEADDNLALVNFSTNICGVLIKESFLWPKCNRSVLEMKLFALNLLTE